VVDDNESNRDLLQRRLGRLGYNISTAENGHEALEMVSGKFYDLVLLDIMMPGLNGYEVLENMKADEKVSHIPVIMISALEEIDSVVKCLELGADDYLTKPFNMVLLKARVGACLERKALRDKEMLQRHQIEAEMHRADELLRVILPENVMEELKETNQVKPRRHEDIAVLICDIVGFTPYCEKNEPEEVLANLGLLTVLFEQQTLKYGLEKINAVGDEFLAASGLSGENGNRVLDCVRCGFEMIRSARSLPSKWEVRVGINVGPVIAGIVGHRKFLFGLWGDTVNTAARTQTSSEVGTVYVTKLAWDQISDLCQGESRGIFDVKGKGPMEMFRVDRVIDEYPGTDSGDAFKEI
jgi:DNA-binding response OmpR family regulator